MTDTPKPRRKAAKPRTELEQSEVQRQRALGAQAVLREELDKRKEAEATDWRMDLRTQIAQADKGATMWKQRAEAAERELERVRQELHMTQMRLSEREGRLAMLERLGTIPEAKAQDFDGMGHAMHPTYGIRG